MLGEIACLARMLFTDGVRFIALCARPGIPDPPADFPVTLQEHRHRIPGHLRVVSHPLLGGLHYEYELVPKAA